MAVASVTFEGTNVTLASTTTGWSGFKLSGGGSAPAPQLDSDVFIQGTEAVSVKISGTSRDMGLWFDNGSGIDFTVTGRHLFLWFNYLTVANLLNASTGGLYIAVSTSGNEVTDYLTWMVRSRDFFPEGGGWVRLVMDLNKTPTRSLGSTDLTDINFIGIGVFQTGTAKSENLVCDRIDYGTGLRIVAGDGADPPCDWVTMADEDGQPANKYGVLQEIVPNLYACRAGLAIGASSGTTSTVFDDTSGATIIFENPQYYNSGTYVSAIDSEELYKIELQGNATGTTDIKFGDSIGSGEDQLGVNGGVIQSVDPKWEFDAETDIADLDSVDLFGMTMQGAGFVRLSDDAKTTCAGCVFNQCDEIQPNDAEFLNFQVVAPEPHRGLELVAEGTHNVRRGKFIFSKSNERPTTDRVWQVDVSTTPDTFVSMTDEWNPGGSIADMFFFPTTEAVGDYWACGSAQQFNRVRVSINTAGVGGVVAWEYWSGSSWTALPNLTDETLDLTTTGTVDVSFRNPADWAATSLYGEIPLFYIRARVTTVYSTNPFANQGTLRRTVEHMVHVPTTGDRTFDDLTFFGVGNQKYDVEYSVAATSVSAYAFSNRDSGQIIGDGTTDGIGQSFGATAGDLSRVRVELTKVGSPSGTIVARLYAHSGTFGSSSIPTGAALATSDAIEVTTISALAAEFDFEFDDEFTMLAATNYVMTIEYTAGDGSNHILVGYDASSPGHAGNKATLASSVWSAQSGHDVVHELWRDGILTVNATNGADPVKDQNTNDDPGSIVISNPKTYTLDTLEAGSEVRIFRSSDSVELGGIESSGTSFVFNHNGATLAIYTIIQKLDFKWQRINDTLGSADKIVTVSQIPDNDYENP